MNDPPRNGAGGGHPRETTSSGFVSSTPLPRIGSFLPVAVPSTDLPDVISLWWRFARMGHRLPAERGVILLGKGPSS